MNPLTEICWQCIFPITIGGVEVTSGIEGLDDSQQSTTSGGGGGGSLGNQQGTTTSSGICQCPIATPPFWRIGVAIGYWSPGGYVETVKDPYCFPALGLDMSETAGGFMGGVSSDANSHRSAPTSFAQSHYFKYPILSYLEVYIDDYCYEPADYAIGYLSEISEEMNDDLSAAVYSPESVLFGNPVAQMACIADSVAANMGYSLDPLFWCMGSWGSAYPMTNNMDNSAVIEANAGIAAKTMYKLFRLLPTEMLDGAVDVCKKVSTPIWYKSHIRMQIARPVRDSSCYPVGRSGLTWSYGKNPPLNDSDNFVWIIFRKKTCCVY